MILNLFLLALLGLSHGQLETQIDDDDFSKILQEIFGEPNADVVKIDKGLSSTCRTGAGENGKCTPPNSCPSRKLSNNQNTDGVCENGDICCPENNQQICGIGNIEMDKVRVLSEGTTKFGEYPWVVAVLNLVPTNDSDGGMMATFASSGSLIHPRVVMTTAHTVQKLKKLMIRAGEWDVSSTDEVLPHQERDVERIILHEAFNTRRMNLHNDIALLVLAKPVDIKPHVNTVCLPSDTSPPEPPTKCFSTGWGKDNFDNGSFQSILKKVELPVVDHSECQARLRTTRLGPYFKLHNSFLCAGGKEGLDTCTGDGGSPLICSVPGENGRFMASGMVSWGIGCGSENPAVYVDVAYLKPWVDEKMEELGFPTTFYTI